MGFLSPLANDEFSMRLLIGVQEACKDQNLILIVRSAMTQREEQEGIRFLRAAGVDGLLIFPVDGEAYSEAVLNLKTEGFPFVLIDRYLPGIKTNAVYSDNFAGGRIGTEFLVQKRPSSNRDHIGHQIENVQLRGPLLRLPGHGQKRRD
ncbi:substrate-binding domain-containing protein [Cohnella rhizosphaerae]|uniref:Substrate-binding domain-containing protein n=1 Tax=Cohnella rhizosphaerae TaxID=1457232 RepID=A0A9X4KTG6_9BACL|nr:substrate-binding domain-containing protein [Cohnella rhizosphaerae]MDG0810468.1 substrate-binding domain-containing protein [Cohnella rhizosphaerae]